MLQADPVIVRLVEQPVQDTSVGDVIIGAIGLTGLLLVTAALLGVLLGAILISVKKLRARYNLEDAPDVNELRVTPHSLT